jgi:hypothetical protein
MAPKNGYSSASVLMSLLEGNHLTTNSQLQLTGLCPRYIGSAWTAEKTWFPTVPQLLLVNSLLREHVYQAAA